ncbi:T9SS type A sorting domain-containing protein [bacterium]|nr:T9SS type A sorting domain-containing protein [bacterium]
MGKTIWILFLIIAVFSLAHSDWERIFGRAANDHMYCIRQTSDGGYIICGQTQSYGPGDNDIYVVKLTESGETEWSGLYGGTGNDHSNYILETPDNGYLIAGYSFSFGDAAQIYILKLNTVGDTLWTRVLGGTHNDYVSHIMPTVEGNYLFTGTSYYPDGTGSNAYLFRLDPEGENLWSMEHGDSLWEFGYMVTEAHDGGYLLCGSTTSFGAGGRDAYLVYFDRDWNTVWKRTYGGSEEDFFINIYPASDNEYLLAGRTASFGAGLWDIYLVKANALGETLWTQTYGGASRENLGWSVPTHTGECLLAGYTSSTDDSLRKAYVIKVDDEGEVIWADQFGGIGQYRANHITLTEDGGYIIAGAVANIYYENYDIYLVKIDHLNNIEWETQIPNLFGINTYPNPFNSACRIETLPNSNLQIFDLNGRLIWEKFSYYRISEWIPDPSLSSGIYLLKANYGGNNHQQRLLYLK